MSIACEVCASQAENKAWHLTGVVELSWKSGYHRPVSFPQTGSKWSLMMKKFALGLALVAAAVNANAAAEAAAVTAGAATTTTTAAVTTAGLLGTVALPVVATVAVIGVAAAAADSGSDSTSGTTGTTR